MRCPQSVESSRPQSEQLKITHQGFSCFMIRFLTLVGHDSMTIYHLLAVWNLVCGKIAAREVKCGYLDVPLMYWLYVQRNVKGAFNSENILLHEQ